VRDSILSEKANRISVIALDLDGTLLRSDGIVTERTLAALGKCVNAEMQIVIATMRPARSVTSMLPPDFPSAPWLCHNGAEIYQNGKRSYQNALSPLTAKEILKIIWAAAPEIAISIEMDDKLFASQPLDGPWIYQVADLYQVIDRPVAKVLFALDDDFELEELNDALRPICQTIIAKDNQKQLAIITALGVSKPAGLQILGEQYGFELKQVIAFGDDLVDLPMLQECGVGVAMGNALPEVKQAADLITLSNDEDGVAETLELLLASRQ
jgi:5-amino-6-(5-phospho-D-ribitylamino)uracil phosphatase